MPILPIFVARACEQLTTKEELIGSGWAQFFLYQTIYCADVEKPSCEEAVASPKAVRITCRTASRTYRNGTGMGIRRDIFVMSCYSGFQALFSFSKVDGVKPR